MLEKEVKISSQSRPGVWHDLPAAPQINLVNHHIKVISGFDIGQKITVRYSPGEILIRPSNY